MSDQVGAKSNALVAPDILAGRGQGVSLTRQVVLDVSIDPFNALLFSLIQNIISGRRVHRCSFAYHQTRLFPKLGQALGNQQLPLRSRIA